ncbi:DUF1697 domain-containing protein [Luteimonas aestuarii]|uniref:DUF1697 domain-containing protein n=1 Tax=Luteimonas aestuarii TaxID=453837 RepID=A0A4R5TVB3_9GAMM|nr:DUF1697 domain-containing protein [Luteimonas aestuarii]TDK25002.1 DUF1697 domain-containing protein [Luteimonas aestuarii]
MAIQVALFRGINVGKAKRIAMVELKALFGTLGFSDVRTLLNSGNVVFEAGRSPPAVNAKRIAAALERQAGFSANTLVLDVATLRAAVEGNPFAGCIDDPSRMLVGFYLAADTTPFESLHLESRDGNFAAGEHACYLWCPDGILESPIGETLASAGFRDRVTTRNWTTTLKLLALVDAYH